MDWGKPVGGLWTSPHEPDVGSAWCRYWSSCLSTSHPRWHTFQIYACIPHPRSRVVVIDSAADLALMVATFPLTHAARLVAEGGMDATAAHLDWISVARHCDAMHVTRRAISQTPRGSRSSLDDWSVESTVWMRWCFTDIVDMGTVALTSSQIQRSAPADHSL